MNSTVSIQSHPAVATGTPTFNERVWNFIHTHPHCLSTEIAKAFGVETADISWECTDMHSRGMITRDKSSGGHYRMTAIGDKYKRRLDWPRLTAYREEEAAKGHIVPWTRRQLKTAAEQGITLPDFSLLATVQAPAPAPTPPQAPAPAVEAKLGIMDMTIREVHKARDEARAKLAQLESVLRGLA